MDAVEHKLGTLYASHDGDHYSLRGDRIIVRARQLVNCDWWVEYSYGGEWEEIGTYTTQNEAIAMMVSKAFELNT